MIKKLLLMCGCVIFLLISFWAEVIAVNVDAKITSHLDQHLCFLELKNGLCFFPLFIVVSSVLNC